jgi:hypothetical protein
MKKKHTLLKVCFIESSFPAFLSRQVNADLFVYSKSAGKYASPNQKKIIIPDWLIRYAKIFCAAIGVYCFFQGGFGYAFRISRSKAIISDGILTEWLVLAGFIKPKTFISVNSIEPELSVNEELEVILGNNFYEFGNFSFSTYKKYLIYLKEKYPNALYFPHPREISDLPEKIFESKCMRENYNIETFSRIHGIPKRLIGFLGSTAMVSLANLAKAPIIINAEIIDKVDCDGPLGDITDPFLLQKMSIEVTLSKLTTTVKHLLSSNKNITIIESNIHFI